jgi:4-oxalocrotonate tautomerase
MPVIEVKMWDGRTAEQKKQIVEGITRVFTDQGVPAQAVHVVLINVKKDDWAIGGKMCSEQ